MGIVDLIINKKTNYRYPDIDIIHNRKECHLNGELILIRLVNDKSYLNYSKPQLSVLTISMLSPLFVYLIK